MRLHNKQDSGSCVLTRRGGAQQSIVPMHGATAPTHLALRKVTNALEPLTL